MENKYYPQHVISLFGVSSETARTWAKEFQRHLSDRARPGNGKHRVYTEDDMRIFALVAQMKSLNMNFREIHASLDNGERADLPPSAMALELPPTMGIQLRLEELEDQLAQIEEERNQAQTTAAVEKALRLHFEKRAQELERDVQNLREEIGGLKAQIKQGGEK